MLIILQKLVREHTNTLLTKNSEDPLYCNVTQEEADEFDDSAGYPCTAENFRLHLAGTAGHKWNKAAAEVFAKSFLEVNPESRHSQVKTYFTTHLRMLISSFRKKKTLETMEKKRREQEESENKARDRRRSRRHEVS